MNKKLKDFLKAYLEGEEATLNGEISFSWWEVCAILIIIGLVIYLIVR